MAGRAQSAAIWQVWESGRSTGQVPVGRCRPSLGAGPARIFTAGGCAPCQHAFAASDSSSPCAPNG